LSIYDGSHSTSFPLTAQGHIRYALKIPYRDGTTHVVFEPLDSIARWAALMPSPRVNPTRTDAKS
jgi:Putative transposase